jgi:hypothetical protein
METPQIIYIAITFIGLLLTANQHGKPRKNTNLWITLISTTIAYSILIWGGFFK